VVRYLRTIRTSDFEYPLPPELIAQEPLPERDASRLLWLDRSSATLQHRAFRDLPELLRPGDLLVLNDTRVLPARLVGTRVGGGAAEVLLLREVGAGEWECLVRPGARLKPGARVEFGASLRGEVLKTGANGVRHIAFQSALPLAEAFRRAGRPPLPPYIRKPLRDAERYQTIHARITGSAAAPTAGLHFTPAVMAALRARAIRMAYVTLHVGLDTFRPVEVDDPAAHPIHREWSAIPEETANAVAAARAARGRIVAAGTTVVRSLESRAEEGGTVQAGEGWTDLFIRPGYHFRAVDAMLTNFHLPRSTLLMLVAAFAGLEMIRGAYAEATAERYRFYSFGDAMLIT